MLVVSPWKVILFNRVVLRFKLEEIQSFHKKIFVLEGALFKGRLEKTTLKRLFYTALCRRRCLNATP